MSDGMSTLGELGDLLSQYVGYGALRDDEQFDAWFASLASGLPQHLRQTPRIAFRVVAVSSQEHGRLLAGQDLALRPRTYGSWTKSADAARRFLRARVSRAEEGQVILLLRKPLPEDAAVADVQAVYRELGWNIGEMECWSRYASWEQEVIVRQDPSLLTIRPGDILATHAARDVSVMGPIPGEEAWHEASDGMLDIQNVPDDQPHAGEGLWLVETGSGESRSVAWNDRVDAWDVTELPSHRPGR